jgi:drug/metabolite transporter (DMT)-like permease
MIDSLELIHRKQQIFDNGPMYNEFVHDTLIHEPWNAYSSLCFFVPVIFWLIYLRGKYRTYGIITALLPLLFLNGLGSTLFHAFRASNWFLLLDWLPAALMTLILSIYFWHRVTHKVWKAIGVVLGFYALAFTMVKVLSQQTGLSGPSIGYFFTGAAFLVPVIIDLKRNQWKHVGLYLLSLFCLVLALLFRILDYPTPNPFAWLPQGTHFLWHVTSSLAVFSLGFYIYKTTNENRFKN